MDKPKLQKGEYLDSRGNVRQYSAKYYARKKQIRNRLIMAGSAFALVLAGVVTAVALHGRSVHAAAEAETGAATQQDVPELMAEAEHGSGAVILPAVDVAQPTEAVVEDTPAVAEAAEPAGEGEAEAPGLSAEDPELFYAGYEVYTDERTKEVTNTEVISEYAILVDLADGHVVAQKNAEEKIYPASMTKVLTLLVAVEHIDDYSETYTMTQEIADYVWKHDCAAVGYKVGESASLEELLYGTILPSGGDAALMLADATAGSMEAFVDMMNEKVEELGLADVAHFANPIGIYDDENYCTCAAMAMIMKAALENEKCREVLGTKRYTTAATEEHPEGIQISNLFLRRIEDKDTHGEVLGAKTGFVTQSRNCAVSYERGNDGGDYICVTTGAHSAWRAIYDHVAIYDDFIE